MQLADVVGQESAKADLRSWVNADRVPHAVLFSGKEGWGILPLALAFVQYFACEEKTNEGDACGVCTSCRQIARLEHPDVRVSFPAVSPKPGVKNLSDNYIQEFRDFIRQTPYGSTYDWLQFINVENKQGNISADECRHIIDSMNLKSYQGGYKIHIIWRPEYLEKEGNRLLKLMEEPPENTLLIFVAEDEKRILPTLLSRLQRIHLKPVRTEAMVSYLHTRKGLDQVKAFQVANIANGSYAAALTAMTDWENELLPSIIGMLNAIYTNNGPGIHEWVEEQARQGREQLKNLLQYMHHLFAAGFRYANSNALPLHLSEKDTEFVHKLARLQLPVSAFEHIARGIGRLSYHIGRNANVKVQLLHFCIQMQYWIKGRELELK